MMSTLAYPNPHENKKVELVVFGIICMKYFLVSAHRTHNNPDLITNLFCGVFVGKWLKGEGV